jgi:hypothetical protein
LTLMHSAPYPSSSCLLYNPRPLTTRPKPVQIMS